MKKFLMLSTILNIALIIVVVIGFVFVKKEKKEEAKSPHLLQYGFSQIGDLLYSLDEFKIVDLDYEKTKYGNYIFLEFSTKQAYSKLKPILDEGGFNPGEKTLPYSTKSIAYMYEKYTYAPLEENGMNYYNCYVYIAADDTVYILIT